MIPTSNLSVFLWTLYSICYIKYSTTWLIFKFSLMYHCHPHLTTLSWYTLFYLTTSRCEDENAQLPCNRRFHPFWWGKRLFLKSQWLKLILCLAKERRRKQLSLSLGTYLDLVSSFGHVVLLTPGTRFLKQAHCEELCRGKRCLGGWNIQGVPMTTQSGEGAFGMTMWTSPMYQRTEIMHRQQMRGEHFTNSPPTWLSAATWSVIGIVYSSCIDFNGLHKARDQSHPWSWKTA